MIALGPSSDRLDIPAELGDPPFGKRPLTGEDEELDGVRRRGNFMFRSRRANEQQAVAELNAWRPLGKDTLGHRPSPLNTSEQVEDGRAFRSVKPLTLVKANFSTNGAPFPRAKGPSSTRSDGPTPAHDNDNDEPLEAA